MLTNGLILKGTECPYKDECSFVSRCLHQGIQHTVDFSCALARAFDLLRKNERIQP